MHSSRMRTGRSLTVPGGVLSPRGCLLGGACLVRGRGEGRVWSGGCVWSGTPHVNRMTHRCKNITLAKTSFRPVTTTTDASELIKSKESLQDGLQTYSGVTRLLPPANKVSGKVIFSEACVKNSVHGGWEYLTRCPPGTRYTPQDQVHPPGQTPPPGQNMLGDTVNLQAIRILLECNLVFNENNSILAELLQR